MKAHVLVRLMGEYELLLHYRYRLDKVKPSQFSTYALIIPLDPNLKGLSSPSAANTASHTKGGIADRSNALR